MTVTRRPPTASSSSRGSNADAVQLGDVVTVTGNAGENQGQSQISLSSPPTVCGTATVGTDRRHVPGSLADRARALRGDAGAAAAADGRDRALPARPLRTGHAEPGRSPRTTHQRGCPGRPRRGAAGRERPAQDHPRRCDPGTEPRPRSPSPGAGSRSRRATPCAAATRVSGLVGVLGYTWGGNAASPNAYRIRPVGALGGQVDFVAANPRPVDPPRRRWRPAGHGHEPAQLLHHARHVGQQLPRWGERCRARLPGREHGHRVRPAGGQDGRRRERHRRRRPSPSWRWRTTATAPTAPSRCSSTGSTPSTGAATWAFIDADARTGQVDALGNDAIKVGMLYRPATVDPGGHDGRAQLAGLRRRG